MNPEFTFYLITACSSLSLPRVFFLFYLRWKALVTSFCHGLFVSRGRRWWTRFSTQSASPTVWRSSLWRMQDSNRRFPRSRHLLFNLISSPCLLLTPSPLKHSSTSPLLTFPLPPAFSLPSPLLLFLHPLFSLPSISSHLLTLAHHPPFLGCLDLSNFASPPFSLPLTSLNLCFSIQ